MNFSDEEYVRLYVSDTVTWRCLQWEGQALLTLALRKFDRSGVLEFGRCGAEKGLFLATGIPVEIIKLGLPRILEEEIWVIQDGRLFWPKYIDAQNCSRSDKLRQRLSRARRAAESGELDGPSKVYFVQSETGGPIKIGFASSLTQRLDALQTARPDKLRLLLAIEGEIELEKSLHDKFAPSRLNGEWFKPDPELLNWIVSHGGTVFVTESGFCHELSQVSQNVTPGEERRGEARDLKSEISDARGSNPGDVRAPDKVKPDDPTLRSMETPPTSVPGLFEAWRIESGKVGATLDGPRRQLFLRIAADGVTVEQVREATRGAKLDPWARDTAKLSPSAILGTAEQREKFIAIARDPPRPKGQKSPRQPNASGGFGAKFLNAGKAGTT